MSVSSILYIAVFYTIIIIKKIMAAIKIAIYPKVTVGDVFK